MTRSLKAVALAALLALGSAAAITHSANGAQTGAYAVARPGRSAAYIIEPNLDRRNGLSRCRNRPGPSPQLTCDGACSCCEPCFDCGPASA